jgi:hypothetical protein
MIIIFDGVSLSNAPIRTAERLLGGIWGRPSPNMGVRRDWPCTPHSGIPSISSGAPSLPTVIITSPSVFVAKPASQYVK